MLQTNGKHHGHQLIPAGTPILPGRYERAEDGVLIEVEPARPCPELLTSDEAARFLRIDHMSDPQAFLLKCRKEGMLRGTKIGRDIRYLRSELLSFLEKLTDLKPV